MDSRFNRSSFPLQNLRFKHVGNVPQHTAQSAFYRQLRSFALLPRTSVALPASDYLMVKSLSGSVRRPGTAKPRLETAARPNQFASRRPHTHQGNKMSFVVPDGGSSQQLKRSGSQWCRSGSEQKLVTEDVAEQTAPSPYLALAQDRGAKAAYLWKKREPTLYEQMCLNYYMYHIFPHSVRSPLGISHAEAMTRTMSEDTIITGKSIGRSPMRRREREINDGRNKVGSKGTKPTGFMTESDKERVKWIVREFGVLRQQLFQCEDKASLVALSVYIISANG